MAVQTNRNGERLQVSFQHFGEATGLPVRILRAAFNVHQAASIGQHFVRLELTVVNEHVVGDIYGKLKMPLPSGATVCRFQFQRDDQWYPAVPVEAKAAKEVVYKEREKGRAVAAASQDQGNIFEIEVFPLRYKSPACCRLWYSHIEAMPPFKFDVDTEVEVTRCGAEDPFAAGSPAEPAACVGECFGEKHFACYVPFVPADVVEAPRRLALLWDASGSQQTSNHALRFERLRCLADQCPGMRFDVWTFAVSFRRELRDVSAEEAIGALSSVSYDGGTDISLLPPLLDALAPADAALLFTDGMDNLDCQPQIQRSSPPVHCVLDQPSVNLACLSAVCLATGGHLLRGEYLPLLRPLTLMARITTDQSDEQFFDKNDGFQCCPDHRLHLQWPVGEEGAWLCGTCGTVESLRVELRAGGVTKEFTFDLSKARVLAEGAAPLLGHLFARQQYAAVQRDGAAMGMDLAKIRAELALKYGFCSPEASLLLLYEPAQFTEHGIECPKDHPAFAARMASRASAEPLNLKGDLGQPKTPKQMQMVSRLAQDLQQYMDNPIPPRDTGRKKRTRACESAVARRCLQACAPPPSRRRRQFLRAWCLAGSAEEECLAERLTESHVYARQVDGAACDDAAVSGAARLGASVVRGSARRDCEAYVQGKEHEYLAVLRDALTKGNFPAVYARLRNEHSSSPSFFLYSAALLLDHSPGRADDAARICTNCLEINLQDVQMMRSVGYFLIKAGKLDSAVAVLDRVRELAPVEPQSFLDGALVRSLLCLQGSFCEKALRKAVELVAVVISNQWAERFDEIEWPALILLHLLMAIGEGRGLANLWPLDAALQTPNFVAGLVVWLGWDTDKTDIDLHIIEPGGNEVYYSNPRSAIGGRLSRDFTQGYGPEVYLLKRPPAGTYRVGANYYASHQQSALTGSTSAVVWVLRGGQTPELKFDTVRLDRNKVKMEVMAVPVPGEDGGNGSSLKFTDTDGDEILLIREGSLVNEYVNGKLEIQGVSIFSIDKATRTYKDDTGSGSFHVAEDLVKLEHLRNQVFKPQVSSAKPRFQCVMM